jgi:hypothetical protein
LEREEGMARKTKPVITELEDVELGEKTQIEVWTDRVLIVGDAHIPHSIRGLKDRLSDLLNQPGKSFLALTDVTISSLSKRRLWRGDFLVVNKSSIVLVKILRE